MRLRHEFVDHIPEQLDDGVLYVSIRFGTVVHRCACGCGEEVVTPLGPAEWRLTYDGRTVSLEPSIGNWSFPCRSHYWVDGGIVRWAHVFSKTEVALVRQKAWTRRNSYYQTERAEVLGKVPGRDAQRGSRRSIIWEKIRALGWVWKRDRGRQSEDHETRVRMKG